MASPLSQITFTDFSGGENSVASPYAIGQNQCQQVVNMILDEHGSLRVRDGTLIQGNISPDTTHPIVKIYDLVLVNGTIKKLSIIQGASVNTLYDRSASPWTTLGTFSTSYALPDIVTFTNEALIAAGNTEQLRSYDGTTFGVPTPNTPSASHVAVHLGQVWVWNTNNTTTASAGPSSLQACDVNNPASWTITSQTFVAKDDGTSGQGLGVFTIAETGISPTATIIAFKDFSAFEVSGTFGSSLSVQKIKSDMGCVAPRSIQFVSGFGILRLCHRGFALYDGVNDTLISEEIRPRIFGRDTYTGIDWTTVNKSMATQVANPPLYICACPVSGASLTRVFVYDLVRRSWSILNFANPISTMQLVLDPNALPSVLGGDYKTGYIRRYFAGDTSDDGAQISWTIRTAPARPNSPMDRGYFRRLLLEVFSVNGGANITATFFYGPSFQAVTKTVQTLSSANPIGGYGSNGYGTSPYGDPTIFQQEQTLVFDLLGGVIANNMYADITGATNGKIRGLEWHLRKKPLTKSVTSVQQ